MRIGVLLVTLLAIVVASFGCDGRETPLAGRGRGFRIAKDSSCTIEIEIPVEADLPSLHAAAAAWTATGGPRMRLVPVNRTTPFEDGRSQLTFGVPGAHCREVGSAGGSAACLADGQEGVTRQRLGQEDAITEADLVLDRGLLARPVRLYEVWLHELGHLLGLDHFPGDSGRVSPAVSVMTNPAPRGASRPGTADVRALGRAYGGRCGTSHAEHQP